MPVIDESRPVARACELRVGVTVRSSPVITVLQLLAGDSKLAQCLAHLLMVEIKNFFENDVHLFTKTNPSTGNHVNVQGHSFHTNLTTENEWWSISRGSYELQQVHMTVSKTGDVLPKGFYNYFNGWTNILVANHGMKPKTGWRSELNHPRNLVHHLASQVWPFKSPRRLVIECRIFKKKGRAHQKLTAKRPGWLNNHFSMLADCFLMHVNTCTRVNFRIQSKS